MIKFDCANLNEKFISSLNELSKDFDFKVDNDGFKLSVIENAYRLRIDLVNKDLIIHITKKVEFFVAIKRFLELYKGADCHYVSKPQFKDLCYMLDCSRNSVPKVITVEKLIRYLAVMGYDSLQLYTEDTLEIDNEPYFGYLRGRFSKEEIKRIDQYALSFGIELVPCIQSLGHLGALTRWKDYSDTFDVNDILLVGNDRTYQLINNILATIKECFTSKRINIGMDEAYMLGRGKYLDKNGYSPRFPIMMQHLSKVKELCTNYGLEIMMWSDMFFAIAFGNYYYEDTPLPQEILDKVPSDINLIYWDYYYVDYEHFDMMLKRHKHFNNKITFAGGAWKWLGFAPDNRFSIASASNALKACKNNGIENVIVTGWGDNGGETSTFSILPTLLYYSEFNYGNCEINDKFKHSFKILTNVDYDDFICIDLPNRLAYDDDVKNKTSAGRHLLYNDLLLGLLDTSIEEGYNDLYLGYAKKLEECVLKTGKWSYLFKTLAKLCRVLSVKAEIGVKLRKAYGNKDKDQLTNIIKELKLLLTNVDDFYNAFYTQWHYENKPHGFDVQDMRIGGLKQRIISTIKKVEDYVNGVSSEIPELDEELLDYYGNNKEYTILKNRVEYHLKRFTTVNVNN